MPKVSLHRCLSAPAYGGQVALLRMAMRGGIAVRSLRFACLLALFPSLSSCQSWSSVGAAGVAGAKAKEPGREHRRNSRRRPRRHRCVTGRWVGRTVAADRLRRADAGPGAGRTLDRYVAFRARRRHRARPLSPRPAAQQPMAWRRGSRAAPPAGAGKRGLLLRPGPAGAGGHRPGEERVAPGPFLGSRSSAGFALRPARALCAGARSSSISPSSRCMSQCPAIT